MNIEIVKEERGGEGGERERDMQCGGECICIHIERKTTCAR